jgi:Zn-dependent protease
MNIFIFVAVLIIFAVTFHEFAHGWMADRCGDPTAKISGRLTLNPLKHLDPVGSVIIPLLVLITQIPMPAWARPVPVNPYNLRNPKQDIVKVALAGPCTNIGMAIFASLLVRTGLIPAFSLLEHLLLSIVMANFFLALFNLVPIPPLDGSKVLAGLLPFEMYSRYVRLEPFGLIILMLFIATGMAGFVFLGAKYLSYLATGERFLHFLMIMGF